MHRWRHTVAHVVLLSAAVTSRIAAQVSEVDGRTPSRPTPAAGMARARLGLASPRWRGELTDAALAPMPIDSAQRRTDIARNVRGGAMAGGILGAAWTAIFVLPAGASTETKVAAGAGAIALGAGLGALLGLLLAGAGS
jgi:hypothetical protein